MDTLILDRPAGPRALRLDRACKKIARRGGGIGLLDGSLIRTRRRTGNENRKYFSGKHPCNGLLVIALTDDKGRPLRISSARPGRTSEITACRHDRLTQKLRAAKLGVHTAHRATGPEVEVRIMGATVRQGSAPAPAALRWCCRISGSGSGRYSGGAPAQHIRARP
ncbi:transposase family protein [Streptomyces sp. NPDC102282]|uniref:transposase family protein n=1 Tax=Streptomyces sp. NPDC102282 TaxID=3366154 RepID=UPI003824D50E